MNLMRLGGLVRSAFNRMFWYNLSSSSITSRYHSNDCCSSEPTEGEQKIIRKLQESFPKASSIHVHDISGGCGSMYEVFIVAEEFRGVRTVAQHRMINEAIKDEIKNMHGLRISTATPD